MSVSRKFTMHRNLLSTVIHAQAGSLAKALLEGVMNSIDKGAKKVLINSSCTQVSIHDDGQGIASQEDIDNHFGCFGTPHEEGDSQFGRFRVGRGQLLSFGKNVWRTHRFRMEVDVQNADDYEYKLEDKLEKVRGCHIDIELYKPMSETEHNDFVAELTRLTAYLPSRVILNGTRVNKDVTKVKWTHEDELAYYLVLPSNGSGKGIELYNMGAYVMELSRYDWGAEGVIVSKQALTLNSARTEVLNARCELILPIRRATRRVVLSQLATSSRRLTDGDRRVSARAIMDAFEYSEESELVPDSLLARSVLQDANGKLVSFDDLLKAPAIALYEEKYDAFAGSVQKAGRALALNNSSMNALGINADEWGQQYLTRVIANLARKRGVKAPTVGFLGEYRRGLGGRYDEVPDGDVPKTSRVLWAFMHTLRSLQGPLQAALKAIKPTGDVREVRFGSSGSSLAWTDGCSYIAVDREFMLQCATQGLAGMRQMLQVLIHEYCHDTHDDETHDHDVVFYAAFHDAIVHHAKVWQFFVEQMYQHYLNGLECGFEPVWAIPHYIDAVHATMCLATVAMMPSAAARKRELQLVSKTTGASGEASLPAAVPTARQMEAISELKASFASMNLQGASSSAESFHSRQRSLL